MLHEHRFQAMDTQVGVWLWTSNPAGALVVREVEAFFAQMEAELSRFRPHSGLSRLNARAGQGLQEVSPLLYTVLAQALDWARRTCGIFDPTVLPALVAAGYDRTFDEIGQGEGATVSAAPTPREGWRRIRMEPAHWSVELPPGVAVDLGGVAKGWAVDRSAEMLAPWGPVLVDAGGDLRAIGVPEEPWPVAVQDPFRPDRDAWVVGLARGGLATSSIGGRCWSRAGRRLHHLIDPRTGEPAATDLHTVTVWAPTATEADVVAKVVLILGSQAGAAFLEAQGWPGWLWTRAGEVRPVNSPWGWGSTAGCPPTRGGASPRNGSAEPIGGRP